LRSGVSSAPYSGAKSSSVHFDGSRASQVASWARLAH